jgi:DNA-directed RNA polymerase specialized sigma24 family protein
MADGAIRDRLERSIDKLPDEVRTVFVTCVVDGMTPGGVCRAVCTRVADGRGTSAQRPKLAG